MRDYHLYFCLQLLRISKILFDFKAFLPTEVVLMRGFSLCPAMRNLSHRWSTCVIRPLLTLTSFMRVRSSPVLVLLQVSGASCGGFTVHNHFAGLRLHSSRVCRFHAPCFQTTNLTETLTQHPIKTQRFNIHSGKFYETTDIKLFGKIQSRGCLKPVEHFYKEQNKWKKNRIWLHEGCFRFDRSHSETHQTFLSTSVVLNCCWCISPGTGKQTDVGVRVLFYIKIFQWSAVEYLMSWERQDVIIKANNQ